MKALSAAVLALASGMRSSSFAAGDGPCQACAKHGVSVDAARYLRGWTEGRYEAEHRNPQPIH